MEQNTSFSAEVWIINQRTKRAFKRVYLSIVAHPKWKCLWWYIYENTIFMMIVGMNVCSSNSAQSFYFLPQRNTRNKTFFNHDAQAGISSFSLLFLWLDNKTRQLILLLERKKLFLRHLLSIWLTGSLWLSSLSGQLELSSWAGARVGLQTHPVALLQYAMEIVVIYAFDILLSLSIKY